MFQRQQTQMANMLPLQVEITRYQVNHPDRDANKILQAMGQHNVSFADASRIVYGEEDSEIALQNRIREEVAKEKVKWDEENRVNFSPEGNGERGGAVLGKVFHINRGNGESGNPRRVPGQKNDEPFINSVASKVSRVARDLY